jgi:mRNA-degrading endonuclease RelE of RelBE toxin-antitoxin system
MIVRNNNLSHYLKNNLTLAVRQLTDKELSILSASLDRIVSDNFVRYSKTTDIYKSLLDLWENKIPMRFSNNLQFEVCEDEIDCAIIYDFEKNLIEDESKTLDFTANSDMEDYHGLREKEWMVKISEGFVKSVEHIDRQTQGKVLVAINDINQHPISGNGSNVQRLVPNIDGFWCYRIDGCRLIYYPDLDNRDIVLLTFAAMGKKVTNY